MGAFGVDSGNLRIAGYELFQGLENDGQLNFLEAVKTSLAPFVVTEEFNLTLGWKIHYYAIINIASADFSKLSKRKGYPDRYDFGMFRWLQGAGALPLQLIDTQRFVERNKYNIIVPVVGYPNFDFPESAPTELSTYDIIISPLYNVFFSGSANTDMVAGDQFAWYLEPGVVADINIPWYAITQSTNPDLDPPGGLQIFWEWV